MAVWYGATLDDMAPLGRDHLRANVDGKYVAFKCLCSSEILNELSQQVPAEKLSKGAFVLDVGFGCLMDSDIVYTVDVKGFDGGAEMHFALVPPGAAPNLSNRQKLSLEWHNTQAHQALEDLRALKLGNHFHLMCKALRVPVDGSTAHQNDGRPALELEATWKPLHRRRTKAENLIKEPTEEPKEKPTSSAHASRGTKRSLDGPPVGPTAFRRRMKLPFMNAQASNSVN